MQKMNTCLCGVAVLVLFRVLPTGFPPTVAHPQDGANQKAVASSHTVTPSNDRPRSTDGIVAERSQAFWPGAYESDWFQMDLDSYTILTHDLGGDPGDYLVFLYGKNFCGGHQVNYGIASQDLKWYGVEWLELNSATITLYRCEHDDETGICKEWEFVKVVIIPKTCMPAESSYDSGWFNIDPDECKTKSHNLGGDPGSYLMFVYGKNDYGIHQARYGGAEQSHLWIGCKWLELNGSTVTICREEYDHISGQLGTWDQAKILILKTDLDQFESYYDSGWFGLTAGQDVDKTHNLGGVPGRYLVFVYGRNTHGVHHARYGTAEERVVGNRWYGGEWYQLNESEITVRRATDDDGPLVPENEKWEEARVVIIGEGGLECCVDSDCADGLECTDDLCSEGVCANPASPVGTPCGDQADTQCDDPDTCDGLGTCEPNYEPSGTGCDDGLFCTETDACDGSGSCLGTGDPCAGGPDCADTCYEERDSCYDLAGTACGDPSDSDCDDSDTCDGAGTCLDNHKPDGTSCDDGLFCNGTDTCASGTCSQHAGDPCLGGEECNDHCNEGPDNCYNPPDAECGDPTDDDCTNPDTCDGAGTCLDNHESDGASCDDSLFCNGADACSDGTCSRHAGYPCAENEWCDDSVDVCVAHGDGDFEPDSDVDLTDFAGFQACFDLEIVWGSACEPANMTGTDGKIDLDDYAAFNGAITGP